MRAHVFLVFMLGVVLTITQSSPRTATAQVFGIGEKQANTELIPQSGFAAAIVFPKQIADDPNFDLFPREIVTAWGLKELGFDPMLINQITFVAKRMEGLAAPPQWGAVLHFEKMQGLRGALINKLEQKRVGDRTLFSGSSQGLPSFLVYDDATMLVGDEDFFEDMITADNKNNLVRLINRKSVKGQLIGFVDIESVRPLLNQSAQMIPGMLPPAITKLKTIPDMIKAIEIGVTAEGRVKTEIIIHADDDETAEKAGKIIADAIDFGSEMSIGAMAAQMDFNDPVQEALVEYTQRVADEFKGQLSPKVSGNKLSVQMNEQATIVPVLIGMLLPAVQQVRGAARRTQSMNNMRQQTLAMLNYESAHGKFPAQANYDKNGKPLLSWRVHVLPFLNEQALYEQFHLDEPWDSPHNKKLIEKMPVHYSSPSVVQRPGMTVYQGIAGEGMMFGKEARGFGDITDGSSNTVLAVEVNPENAVPWTQPTDFTPDERNPLKGLGQVNPGGFIVSFADGSTHFISNSINPETWKNLLTIGDGNIVDPSDL